MDADGLTKLSRKTTPSLEFGRAVTVHFVCDRPAHTRPNAPIIHEDYVLGVAYGATIKFKDSADLSRTYRSNTPTAYLQIETPKDTRLKVPRIIERLAPNKAEAFRRRYLVTKREFPIGSPKNLSRVCGNIRRWGDLVIDCTGDDPIIRGRKSKAAKPS